ncbi:hypothetical protein A5886_000804 [Enterococcus sp. 8G7_MSG3316]|uniref:Integral membrane protein n=1 Tax=Candidatus Enterococcus testudinis TaxID=1834191 RepID=A0A242A3V8_9ENTE|nr:hypothetical protein [Enterococcus sp. 8G7_MSG3316]OTN75728.1 hypothetical protein A5886_000804 [Enterococcus sp. 8G7_MSG3316]
MNTKKLAASLLFYSLSALGISMTIKAGVGVSSFNALNVTLASAFIIKAGTVTTIINLLFLLLCWIIEGNQVNARVKRQEYLVMGSSLLFFGYLINGFVYTLFAPVQLTSYSLRLLCFVLGTTISGIGTGQVLRLHLLKFPIEHFCQLIAQKSRWSFKQLRYGIDFVCIALAFIVATGLALPLVIREGTIISFFLLSGAIAWSKERNLIVIKGGSKKIPAQRIEKENR